MLADAEAFATLKDLLIEHAKTCENLSCVVGLESRGFLFGTIIASELNIPFVPIRKKGKLPGKLKSIEYKLEYGEDVFEVQIESLVGSMNVLIVDDLLATGGSLKAAVNLLKQCNANVLECFVVMELSELEGRDNLSVPVHSLLKF